MDSTGAQHGPGSGPDTPLSGGRLLSAISTGSVKLMRDCYGRGPIKAKTYAYDDMIVCVLRESGLTPLEKTILDAGHPERIVAMREAYQITIAERYKAMVEDLTGRRVLAFLSRASLELDISLEVFFIDRPLDGFGTAVVNAP